jgi:hypothetical protein
MKWMHLALNGRDKVDLASTFHLTEAGRKQVIFKSLEILNLNQAGPISPIAPIVVCYRLDSQYVRMFHQFS